MVPGAGHGYEPAYLYQKGFLNTFYLDFSKKAIEKFKTRYPDFPEDQILSDDFFNISGQYDMIVELAFFTSIVPEKRTDLARKIYELLKSGGKYVGLFFNHTFDKDYPPFGAIKENYLELVKDLFRVKKLEPAYNSIKPRAGKELFFIFEKH